MSKVTRVDEIAVANWTLTISLFQTLNALAIISDEHAELVITHASDLLAEYGFLPDVESLAQKELGKLLKITRNASVASRLTR